MKYSELTRRYFDSCPGAGVLTGPEVFRGSAGSRERGAWVQFDLRVSDGTVHEARFQALGCPHTLAVAAWLVECGVGTVAGASMPESVQSLSERFAVPVEKRGRLLLIEDAWRAALRAAAEGLTA